MRRFHGTAIIVVAIFAAVLGLAGGSTSALARTGARTLHPHLVHLRFRELTVGVPYGISDGRYVLVAQASQIPTPAVVVDDAMGRVIAIPEAPSPCVPIGISQTNIVYSCGDRWTPEVRSYSFTQSAWGSMPQFDSGCQADDPTCGAQPSAVGRDWIEYQVTPCYHCDGYSGSAFQNLQTGKVIERELGPRLVADLNLPDPLQTLCAPLRVPKGGSLVPVGRFAAESLPQGWDGEGVIAKCGSKRPVLQINGSFAFSPAQSRAILWQEKAKPILDGIVLPSLHRITIPLPRQIFATGQTLTDVLFTRRTLYLATVSLAHPQQSEVWSAPAATL